MNGGDWRDDVESQVGSGLDGRNFTAAADDLGDEGGTRAESGTMLRLNSSPGRGEPQNWEVTAADDVDSLDSDELDGFTRTLNAEQRLTIRGRDGQEEQILLENRQGNPRIAWSRSSDYAASIGIDATRQSVPDDWGSDYPDADEILGSEDLDDDESAFRNLIDNVNKAWYRMSAATRELGQNESADLAMVGGYDAKNAHETLARINEVMRSQESSLSESTSAMRTLVKYHPGLLEAYRNVYEIPEEESEILNYVLEKENVGFRVDADEQLSDIKSNIIDDKY
jgi:hypothetical protein